MVVTDNELKTALSDILLKTNDVTVQNVIGFYNSEKSGKENIQLLHTCSQRQALRDTSSFLKSLSSEYPVSTQIINNTNRVKEEYARAIVKFIEFLKPTQCLICKENYTPASEENQAKCFLCHRPSHSKCYKEHNINPEIGVIFVCSECLSLKAANELATEIQNNTEKTTTDKPQESDLDELQQKAEDDKEDCPLYMKRVCPHGLTGKREINGKPCPYKHRKLCRYFSQYGSTGCHFSKKCRYFHPQICENSEKLKICLNKTCQEFHIKGTRRIEPRDWNYQNNSMSNEESQYRGRKVQPWDNNAINDQECNYQNNNTINEEPHSRGRNISPWDNNTRNDTECNQTEHKQIAENETKNFQNFLAKIMEEKLAEISIQIDSKINAMMKSTPIPMYIPTNYPPQAIPTAQHLTQAVIQEDQINLSQILTQSQPQQQPYSTQQQPYVTPMQAQQITNRQ